MPGLKLHGTIYYFISAFVDIFVVTVTLYIFNANSWNTDGAFIFLILYSTTLPRFMRAKEIDKEHE